MFLSSSQIQILDKMEFHSSDLLERILVMPCTLVALSDYNFTCASGTFANIFGDNFSARKAILRSVFVALGQKNVIFLDAPFLVLMSCVSS